MPPNGLPCPIKAEVKKLNAFQSRCLRKLIGVKPSYWSRVSNQTVLQTVGAKPFSQLLLQQQLQYFGDIARRPTGHVLRDMIFQAHDTKLVQVPGPRRKGRPRNTWAAKLYSEAVKVAGDEQHLRSLLADTTSARKAWQKAVSSFCSNASDA